MLFRSWSWQSDTLGKIGRHFVRDVLGEAIGVLRQPDEIEEPSERDRRETLHLDHDRKDVPGSPDLAPTILRKIEQAAVFVADVTLVGEVTTGADAGEEGRPKRLINSNVAIEYGYALGKLTDEAILMVQNRHFGEREELPFHVGGVKLRRELSDASSRSIDNLVEEFMVELFDAAGEQRVGNS